MKAPETTLRRLVMAEIGLTTVLMAIGFIGEPFLPPTLQAYFEAQSGASMTTREGILVAIDLLVLVGSVVAWVGLWRGWRSSRRVYTLLWVASLPLLLAHGPDVVSGVSQLLDTVATLVGGLILGLLYFSELRQRYEQPSVA